MNNYRIQEADADQRRYVFDNLYKDDKLRESAVVYVALDGERIIGRIIASERPTPEPLDGKYWFIHNLLVHPDYRRRGVATALTDELTEAARRAGALYLFGSANPTAAACRFWYGRGFTLNAYGKKREDEGRPDEYGNFSHMFCYRLTSRSLGREGKSFASDFGYRIVAADGAALAPALDGFMSCPGVSDGAKEFFRVRRDSIFGLAAINGAGEPVGYIAACRDEMGAPLEDTKLWLPFIFVRPELRRHGIGRALAEGMVMRAREKGAAQLTAFRHDEEETGFWYGVGFDVFFWGVNFDNGRRSVTASLRVDTRN